MSISLSSLKIFAVKLESCHKTYKILDVFCRPKFWGGRCPQISYLRYHPNSEPHQMPKFCRYNSKVISANSLDFMPIFDPPLKKSCKGAPVPGGWYASKTWSFSSACKNLGAQHPLGAEIWSSEKFTLGGYNSTSRSPRSVSYTHLTLPTILRV